MTQKHPIRHHGHDPQAIFCNGKRSYDSKDRANAVKAEQELMNVDLKLAVYRCLGCKMWHLTRTIAM